MRILSIITLPGFLVGADFANNVSLAATGKDGTAAIGSARLAVGATTAAACTLRGYKRGGGADLFLYGENGSGSGGVRPLE
jgi:hypothetical protein